MNYIKFLLPFFFISANYILPQIKWMSPSPSPSTIYSLFFVDSLNGWAAGASSCVLKTTDGGETWKEQFVPLPTTLRKIYFSDRNKGVIIGGEVWAPYSGSVLVTTDGGDTWVDRDPISYPNDTRGFNDLHFLNESVGYIAGFNGVYKTYNMGQTWLPKGGTGWATAIYFTDAQTGYLGNTTGSLLKTTDGAGTWVEVANMHWTWHKDIKFVNSQVGWLVSTGLYDNYGIIRKTTDGGLSWAVQDSQTNTCYNAIQIIDPLNVIVVGEGGRILYTTDGGSQWYSGGANDDGEYYDIVLQGTRKWITGEKNGFPRLFVSTESGFPWKLCSSVLTENSLSDISFSDSSKGWLVGSNGTLLKTIDGGENWEHKTIFSIHLNSVSTPTDEDIYIGGSDGEFVKSTNGGTSWQVNNIGYYVSDTKIEFFSKYTGYCLAGDQGLLLKTTNAGNSWSDDILSGNYVDQMFFVDSLNGWAVVFPICSGDYLLFRTTNGGETWADTTIIPMVNCIFFLDTKTGWMVNFNALYNTSNAGKDWELSAQLGELSPKQVWFLDESQGYMIGYSGNIGEGLYVTSD